MASSKKSIPRDFKNRGVLKDGTSGKRESLSTNLPKPNILRVEVLDGNARQRYLAAIQRAGDEIRENVYQQTTQPGERVFYGFLVGGSETGFNMGSSWKTQTGSNAVLDSLKGLAGSVSGMNTIVGGIDSALDGIGDIGGSLLGINKSTTGSGTVKDFEGVTLDDFTIKCGWYLPEQYHLCIKSLKTIYRMAYPKQTDLSVIDDLIHATSNYMKGKGSDKVKAANDALNNEPEPAGVVDSDGNAVVQFIGGAAKAVMQVQEAFGSNYTFNPLPVRVSVGQYMDIEPLVITGVNTSFSKETFINYSGSDKGRHLPIMVTTELSFKYWLNPAPDLQFVNLLGQELFGTEAVPNVNPVVKKESGDSFLKRTNPANGKSTADYTGGFNGTASTFKNL